MLHKYSLHKLIFCFTTVKFVCCYCSLFYSGSTNSTSLLCSFVRCVDIKYEFKKKLLKSLILRDTNKKCFDVSRFTISLRQSYWRWKIIKTTAVQKEEVLDYIDKVESNSVHQMNNECYKSYSWIGSEIRWIS